VPLDRLLELGLRSADAKLELLKGAIIRVALQAAAW
jgi:hypothetical protein